MATRTTTLRSRIDIRPLVLVGIYLVVLYVTLLGILTAAGLALGDGVVIRESVAVFADALIWGVMLVVAVAVTVTHWYVETRLDFYTDSEGDVDE